MGNCSPKPQTRSSKIQLHGSETSLTAWRIRAALLHKVASVEFVACEASAPFLKTGAETVTGPEETLLRYIDKRFGGAPAAARKTEERGVVAEVLVFQHRSIGEHMEGMARWAEKMVERGGGRKGGAAEGRIMGKLYGELVEIMLEHAQMEERFIFQALDSFADADVCRSANEEHGRDLPLMNGIKEDIKSLIAMDVGGPLYKEVLLNLSHRFRTLKERCKQHFEDEERDLLPLLEAAESVVRRREGEEAWPPNRWVQQMVDLMEQTHSRLFAFFTAALFPHEVLRYVSLISGGDEQRSIALLRSIVVSNDTSTRPSLLYNACN